MSQVITCLHVCKFTNNTLYTLYRQQEGIQGALPNFTHDVMVSQQDDVEVIFLAIGFVFVFCRLHALNELQH